jgi:hypothetical protein
MYKCSLTTIPFCSQMSVGVVVVRMVLFLFLTRHPTNKTCVAEDGVVVVVMRTFPMFKSLLSWRSTLTKGRRLLMKSLS